jgi:CRISPR system Cascade subunit CasD
MANTLFLRLEGPMQSWGERARWSVRDTAPEPTKSGVVGLLACALGMNEDSALRALSHRVRMGVRCDQPGSMLVDYHTVVGGVMSAEGKIKKNQTTKEPETVVSWRSYLCDAAFLVAIQADSIIIEELATAIQSPHWPIFLGRKSCPPSNPPFVGIGDFASLPVALEAIPIELSKVALSKRTADAIKVRAVIECLPTEGVLRRDEIDTLSRRTYTPRYTREVYVSVKIQNIVNEES